MIIAIVLMIMFDLAIAVLIVRDERRFTREYDPDGFSFWDDPR